MNNDTYTQFILGEVAAAWNDAFKNRPMLLRVVCKEAEKIPELREALNNVCFEKDGFGNDTFNVRRLGWFLKRNEKKKTNGHHFVFDARNTGSLYWSLVPCEQSQIDTPSPQPEPPPDIHGDIHLMAMTILEKLQPVLLNAIYTELMEHQK